MKHLPDHVKADLARDFGTTPKSLTLIGGGQDWSDGTVFDFPLEASPSGRRVLKILTLPAGDKLALDRATERLQAVHWLGEQGCPIITPVLLGDGQVFREHQDGSHRFLAYSYDKVEGRHVKDETTSRNGTFYSACGEVLGRLHAAWESRHEIPDPEGKSTINLHLGFWKEELAMFRSQCQDESVCKAWDHLETALSGLPRSPATYGFVHNDAHVWNLLFDPDRISPGPNGVPGTGEPVLTLLDFDCANYHWYLSDCAVTLYSFLIMVSERMDWTPGSHQEFQDWAFARFWTGYQRWRPAEPAWKKDLDIFLQYRRCLLYTVMQGETQAKPDWRKGWIKTIVNEDKNLFG